MTGSEGAELTKAYKVWEFGAVSVIEEYQVPLTSKFSTA